MYSKGLSGSLHVSVSVRVQRQLALKQINKLILQETEDIKQVYA